MTKKQLEEAFHKLANEAIAAYRAQLLYERRQAMQKFFENLEIE